MCSPLEPNAGACMEANKRRRRSAGQSDRDTEAQRQRDTGTQRHRDTEIEIEMKTHTAATIARFLFNNPLVAIPIGTLYTELPTVQLSKFGR